MAYWAQLIPDLLLLIAKKVELYEDFVAFRGVCRSWRSVAEKNILCPVKQVPWLLLAGDDDDNRDFYSLTKGGMVHSVYLPGAKGKRILSSLGWLITIDIDGEMELLHPLSRSRIPLPGASKCSHFDILRMDPISMLLRAALSASPSDDEAYTLMIVIGSPSKLAYWRPGNDAWIIIETPQESAMMMDVVYFGGQFYAVNSQGGLFSVDINNKTADVVGRMPPQIFDSDSYLVDSGDGHMIAVLREIGYNEDDDTFGIDDYRTDSFELFKFDSSYNCHPINDLGEGRSLFVGRCASVLVSVRGGVDNVRPNCIYFTDDAEGFYADNNNIAEGGGRDMGVYSLQEPEIIKDVTPLYHGNKGRSRLCPPFWVVPTF